MAKRLRDFLREIRLHPLVAWTRYFDVNYDRRIDAEEFKAGMVELDYPDDIDELFSELDKDGSGFITMNEIDHVSTDLWNSFRSWCGQTFGSAEEMEAQLTNCVFSQGLFKAGITGNKLSKEEISARKATLVALGGFTKKQFMENSVRLGWYGESEVILFKALDKRRVGRVCAKDVGWFEKERWRQVRLHAVRTRGGAHQSTHHGHHHLQAVQAMQTKVQSGRALRAFLTYLRRNFGCLFRAWRCLLDLDGSMSVSRKEFFKSCRTLGWSGDVSSLWHALDSDDSGVAHLQELAPYEARVLALFKRWADEKYGSSKSAMQALNTCRGTKFKLNKAGRLNKAQFVEACGELQCPCDSEELFDLLDYEMDGAIAVNEMKCLDKWQVKAEWLTGIPDQEAAKSFLDILLTRYRHAVKAWCRALDRCSCGRATWPDFKWAVEHIGFKGNYIGAWLALDVDSSGFITLREIDELAAGVLAQFRCWAHDAFGSVVLAIEALDVDQSGSLSLREFRRGLKDHGFRGDPHNLFFSLDCDGSGELSASEVQFLDEWELSEILDFSESFPHDECEDQSDVSEPEIKNFFADRKKVKTRKKRHVPWPRLNMVGNPTPPHGGKTLNALLAFSKREMSVRRKQAIHESILFDLGYANSANSSRTMAWSSTSLSSVGKVSSSQEMDSEDHEPVPGGALLDIVGCVPGKHVVQPYLPGQLPRDALRQQVEEEVDELDMDNVPSISVLSDLDQEEPRPTHIPGSLNFGAGDARFHLLEETLQQKVQQKLKKAPWSSSTPRSSTLAQQSTRASTMGTALQPLWEMPSPPPTAPSSARSSLWKVGPSIASTVPSSARSSLWKSAPNSTWTSPRESYILLSPGSVNVKESGNVKGSMMRHDPGVMGAMGIAQHAV